MFNPVHLQSFLSVAETRSFSEAARRLDLQQSTVSQHVRRLEDEAGRRLFVRDTHSVTLTADGEAMTGFAQSIIDTQRRAQRYFAGSTVRGRLRFGSSEDFVGTRLPDLLRDFVAQHSQVDLELKVGVSATLHDYLDAGELDLILAKRRFGDDSGQSAGQMGGQMGGQSGGGQSVWRDRLAWIGAPGLAVDLTVPVPLILYEAPSITRTVALEALEHAGLTWRIVCTSGSLSGLRAACLAGLGVSVHARGLIPEGLAELPGTAALPDLMEVDFVVRGARSGLRGPAAALAQAILSNADRLQRWGYGASQGRW